MSAGIRPKRNDEEPLKSLTCRHDRDTIKDGEIKFIESHRYPTKSNEDEFCRWTLRTNPGLFIKITFEVLDVGCSYDVNGFFIDDQGVTSPAICGSNRQYLPVYSTGHEIGLTFNAARTAEVMTFTGGSK